MPELAEVEVVRNTLNNQIDGCKIIKIDCLYKNIIIDYDNFINKVLNKKIIEIKRYAKYLIFVLEDGAFLSHLRMEGKYFYVPNDYTIKPHQHIVFYLDNGYKLIYQDVRKFGRIEYKNIDDIYTTPPLSLLGVEANSNNYNLNQLYDKLIKKSIPIKSILLDQSFISGLGNIYADEVLFASKINPLTKGFNISKQQLNDILINSKNILDKAIINNGTTIRSYTSSLGITGNYQNHLMVHTKKNCIVCNNEIKKIKIGGRSTYYCNKCQGEV